MFVREGLGVREGCGGVGVGKWGEVYVYHIDSSDLCVLTLLSQNWKILGRNDSTKIKVKLTVS